jgi:fatty-acyl-CoA synthase
VPDQRLNEVCMAYVKLRKRETATLKDLIDYYQGKIANFKFPRYVKFFTEFSATASGNIQKFKLGDAALPNSF